MTDGRHWTTSKQKWFTLDNRHATSHKHWKTCTDYLKFWKIMGFYASYAVLWEGIPQIFLLYALLLHLTLCYLRIMCAGALTQLVLSHTWWNVASGQSWPSNQPTLAHIRMITCLEWVFALAKAIRTRYLLEGNYGYLHPRLTLPVHTLFIYRITWTAWTGPENWSCL